MSGRKYPLLALIALLILIIASCATNKSVKKSSQKVIPEESNTINNQQLKTEDLITSPATTSEENSKNISKNQKSSEDTNNKKTELTELYKKKHAESIMETIKKLEECYETGDFDRWKSMLTSEYIKRYNDPEFLKEHGWNATDLKSFFFLLIETRKKNGIRSLPISRVEFISPTKANVYVILNGREFPKPQHTFIKIGDSWYKGLPDEGD